MELSETESESEFALVDSLNWCQVPLLECGCVYIWSNWSSPPVADLTFTDTLFPSLQDKHLPSLTRLPQGLSLSCNSINSLALDIQLLYLCSVLARHSAIVVH